MYSWNQVSLGMIWKNCVVHLTWGRKHCKNFIALEQQRHFTAVCLIFFCCSEIYYIWQISSISLWIFLHPFSSALHSRDVPFWQRIFRCIIITNIIFTLRPTSPEPNCAQGWVSPQQIQCRSVWLHWEPVFHFTGWTGWCYISDISLSVTTESIGSPWNSIALGVALTV